jgi:hypothetical protein
MKKNTTEEVKAKVQEVKNRGDGISLALACKNAGISVNTFYYWTKPTKKVKTKIKGKLSAKAKKHVPYVQEIPVERVASAKVVCLIGSPADIARIMGSLN